MSDHDETVHPHVRLDVVESVATITLDRPAVMNAIAGRAGGTRDQIIDAVERAEADRAVGCIVLRGAGANFCGGGDLTGNAPRETAEADRAFLTAADEFHQRVRRSSVPIVCAVQGYCLGAGLTLAASCDLVIASEDARFGFPEGRLGLVGVSGLVPIIGPQWAKFLIMTGELIDADTAVRLGLVLAIEPTDQLIVRTEDLARRISRMPRESVRRNRRTIDAVADAAGEARARAAAIDGDTETLGAAPAATAPDGRTFQEILRAEGMAGMKAARAQQYDSPWLR